MVLDMHWKYKAPGDDSDKKVTKKSHQKGQEAIFECPNVSFKTNNYPCDKNKHPSFFLIHSRNYIEFQHLEFEKTIEHVYPYLIQLNQPITLHLLSNSTKVL